MTRPRSESHRYCDGIPRRAFLRIGGLAMGGLSLVDLLRAEESAGRRSHKAVIMVYLSGGLSHYDSFDMKPAAPAEVRGEFKPVATNVPGGEICELLPKTAAMLDKFAVIRSIVGLRDEHSSYGASDRLDRQTRRLCGRPSRSLPGRAGHGISCSGHRPTHVRQRHDRSPGAVAAFASRADRRVDLID